MSVRSPQRSVAHPVAVQRLSWVCAEVPPAIHATAATVIDVASQRDLRYAGDDRVDRTPLHTDAAPPRCQLDHLTPREREVIELVVRGATDREIARDLRISTNTVNEYLMKIKRKLGAANRVSLATLYYGDDPYFVPARDEAPLGDVPVEVAPTYANYVRGCTQRARRS